MKKKDDSNLPPSLFDDLSLFAVAAKKPDDKSASASGTASASAPKAEPKPGLTGAGPMRDLYDFNFRQYSAYVICSRAIPAVEDGLKPVQRRIMHSLW